MQMLLEWWPELTVKPGHDEIENPDSPLAKIRAESLITASNAGVLWNVKRNTSYGAFVEEKLGLRTPKPFNDWVKALMEAGRQWEPKIDKLFANVMKAEFRRIHGGQLNHYSPGPHVRDEMTFKTAATCDGLFTFKVDEVWYALGYEIKFFASKTVMPTELPQDYLAQVLLQMRNAGSSITLLIGAVLVDNVPQFRIWKIQAKPEHHRDMERRLSKLASDISHQTWPKRMTAEGDRLTDMVVGFTNDCVDVWDFITRNLKELPRAKPKEPRHLKTTL